MRERERDYLRELCEHVGGGVEREGEGGREGSEKRRREPSKHNLINTEPSNTSS